MTTAASRPGGKFGGKFSGRGKTTLPSSRANASSKSSDPSSTSKIGADNDNSTKKKITMEMIKSKRAKIKRHEVFDKLDLAESIVLDILNIAKDTTKGFEFLASPHLSCDKKTNPTKAGITSVDGEQDKIMKMEVDGDGDADGDHNDEEEGEEEKIRKAEQEWKQKIRHNGKSYMENMKKIHDLLIPHADLVVNYSNIAKPREGNTNETKANPGASGKDEERTIKKKETNMYASRLEMRLAIDKKDLLNDLVQLEKKMLDEEMKSLRTTLGRNESMNDKDNSSLADANTNKRKREEP